jgi:anaerobic magnesium-protoporphyrin IX monomethyl ester cyclase
MGEMNMGTAAVSAALKAKGHQTAVAFDPSLFDEHLYFVGESFPMKQLAALFSQREKVIQKIIDMQPDLVAIGVISDTYKWAIDIAKGVKEHVDVPIIFGGLFATNCFETPLSTPWVDIVCIGEGEQPMVELCNAMERGEIDHSIPNLVFKKDDGYLYNAPRPLQDMDDLQPNDIDLFKDDINIGNRYYTLSSKGCIISCTFCSQAFYEIFNETRDPRRRSVDLIIDELAEAKKKYNVRLFDFEDNILFSNKKWFREFAPKYAERVGVPYICMGHPVVCDDETARLLSESGCYRLQLGIQTMNEKNRQKLLRRPETNEQVRNCFDNLDRYKVKYSCDHIFGLPNELGAVDLYEAAVEYSKCEMINKVNTFFLTVYPKTPMVKQAIEWGMIQPEDEELINAGNSAYYYDYGITSRPDLKRLFRSYAIFYRIMPAMPKKMRFFILRTRLFKVFAFFPKTIMLFLIDLFLTFKNWDPVSRHVIGTYLLWTKKIIFHGGVKYDGPIDADKVIKLWSEYKIINTRPVGAVDDKIEIGLFKANETLKDYVPENDRTYL